MNPTGRLLATDAGVDLVLTRTIRGSLEDVWASVTEPDRSVRWYGRWEGEAGPGKIIRLQMAFEEGDDWSDVRIEVCEPPTRLAVTTLSDWGSWELEILLRSTDATTTELTFVQHHKDTAGIDNIGPGWEYYLDNLIASRNDQPLPSFDDYFPSMQPYYLEQISALGQATAASSGTSFSST